MHSIKPGAWKQRSRVTHTAGRILLLLLSIDVMFIMLHILATTYYLGDRRLLLTRERGYSEIVQYIKESGIIILLVWLSIRRQVPVFLSWALFFVYVLVDDAFQFHEQFGAQIARYVPNFTLLSIREEDIGELAVFGLIALCFTLLFGLTYWRSSTESRRITRPLLMLVALLVAFGVIADLMHAIYTANWWWNLTLGVIEDGGEMVIMSIVVVYLLQLVGRNE